LSILLFVGIGAAQAQQPDPLTITKDGNVGIGTATPANKLSVADNADVSGKLSVAGTADFNGNVGLGTKSPLGRLHLVTPSVTDRNVFAWDNRFLVVGGDANTGGISLSYNQRTNTGYLMSLSPSGAWRNTVIQPFDGNVGIGTDPQYAKLQVAGGATTALRLDANSGVGAMSIGGTGELLVDAPGVTGGRLIVKDNGNVGIGTNNPIKAKLEINGFVITNTSRYGYLTNIDGPPKYPAGVYTLEFSNPYSVWASDKIAASEFNALSDQRIKNIQGRSDSATDLRTLLGIEITDYRYKDVIGKGNDTYKKVIGQQVEKVFPQAVSRHTDVVPDIYQQASVQDGWVVLATDLKKGERVKLITEKGEAGIHEVLAVAQGKFRVDFKSEAQRVFVYGREVKDFRTVDYEAISILNVSATQELARRLEKLEASDSQLVGLNQKGAEVKALEEENTALRSQLAEQQKRLAELEAKDKSRDEKLAAIETLLLSTDKLVGRSVSLTKVNPEK
jgi:hypothetical protein